MIALPLAAHARGVIMSVCLSVCLSVSVCIICMYVCQTSQPLGSGNGQILHTVCVCVDHQVLFVY